MGYELFFKNGFTLLEVVLSVGLILILFGVGFWALDPFGEAKLRRDELRLNDLAAVKIAIDQELEKGVELPNNLGIPRSSVGSDNTDWVNMDLSANLPALSKDPLNGKTFEDVLGSSVFGEYQFISDGKYWVVRAHLEARPQKYAEDGNDNTWYEVGNAPGMSSYFGL